MGCFLSKKARAWRMPEGMSTLLLHKRDVHSKTSTQNWVFFADVRLQGEMEALCLQAEWNDQGWGNSKGSIKVELHEKKASGVGPEQAPACASFTIGPAPKRRGYTEHTVRLEDHDNMCKKSAEGMWLEAYYLVGGGGGHELHIHRMGLSCEYGRGPPRAEEQEKRPSDILPENVVDISARNGNAGPTAAAYLQVD